MLVFPQLATGVSGQFPLVRREVARTVVNSLGGGATVRYSDPSWASTQWQIAAASLTAEEWSAIETLFDATEGRLRNFVFLDPADNLLAWSEDFSNAVWRKDPMLQATAGVADPLGTARATQLINMGQAAQRVSQQLNAPGWYQYCFSVYARSSGGPALTMVGGGELRTFPVTNTWTRYVLPGRSANTDEMVQFGIELAAGAAVELFGLQVEAQIGASGYKKTVSRSGIYTMARFQDDRLTVTAQGPDDQDTVIRIISANEG